MIRLAAFAAVLLASSAAFAAPTLRAEALVSAEIVTLGDLADDAGADAGVALFRAPDYGLTGAVPADVVIAAARRAGVEDVSAGLVSEIAVTRLGRSVTGDQVMEAIAARAAADLGAEPSAMRVTLDDDRPVHLSPQNRGAVEVSQFALDSRTGRFEALLGADRGARGTRVTGAVVETVEVAVTARPLARGEVLRDADLIVERRPKAGNGGAVDLEGARGLATRRALREGQTFRANDLMRPQHVERGGFVTLVYGGSGMSLSLKAKALASGAQGDLIDVQNVQSKRIVSGVVTGPSEVTVTAAPTAIARR
ncbi:flagella basal body P-ring formation protein FlgA [Methylopila capsulata]|uniref:Flagella basal body P-ring formation protein FlgA n=1 Tax=Methylopila capsulata TaxID=61654 RepID=A0A9W6IPH0_9HYPH|nr:flagellar basal body P-ring formation chaperone FlgA [Methylopila capsulata]MBM7851064.1 flagella basal body P-ring formation protein FlgA [Methylopila capsulata]GLK54122.1 flagellar basal body P-ring biosynthesis protein FlgA [Methylopila capsulata]